MKFNNLHTGELRILTGLIFPKYLSYFPGIDLFGSFAKVINGLHI